MSFRFRRRQGMGAYLMGHSSLRVGGGGTPVVPVPAGEVIHAGQLVSLDDSTISGTATAWLAQANGLVHRQNPVGYAQNDAAIGQTVNILVAGEQAVVDAYWDTFPGTADVGALVFMSETAGNSTITAPLYTPSVVEKVGVVGFGGTGAGKVIVQIGNGVESTTPNPNVSTTAMLWYDAQNIDGANNSFGGNLTQTPVTYVNLGTIGAQADLTRQVGGNLLHVDGRGFDWVSGNGAGYYQNLAVNAGFSALPFKLLLVNKRDASGAGRDFNFTGGGANTPALFGNGTFWEYASFAPQKVVVPGQFEYHIFEATNTGITWNFSGVTTLATASAQPLVTIAAVALFNYASNFGVSPMNHGGNSIVGAWAAPYPTDAQIVTYLATRFPAFPFT